MKEKIAMIDEAKPLPVEANNSTIELHLAVEAKENFAIVNLKYGSLAEASTHFHVEITSFSFINVSGHIWRDLFGGTCTAMN